MPRGVRLIMTCDTIERYENGMPVYKKKRAFNTLEEAITEAKKVNSGDFIIHKVVAYRCDYCFKFHLGKNGHELTEKERAKFKSAIKK